MQDAERRGKKITAKIKRLGGRLDTVVTNEYDTDEHMNFLYWI